MPSKPARCAVEIQEELAARNAELPKDRRLEFRIGINLGDVMVEGDDLFGDGVNVAARLQALAEPGGIYVSGGIYDQIKGKLPFGADFLGEQTVKNIAEPVRIYRLRSDRATLRRAVRGGGAPGRRSLRDCGLLVDRGWPARAWYFDLRRASGPTEAGTGFRAAAAGQAVDRRAAVRESAATMPRKSTSPTA